MLEEAIELERARREESNSKHQGMEAELLERGLS